MIGKIPGEFRIQGEIIGDLLAEMPELSVRPPGFKPTGRYTLERKEKIDNCHEGDFL